MHLNQTDGTSLTYNTFLLVASATALAGQVTRGQMVCTCMAPSALLVLKALPCRLSSTHLGTHTFIR